MTSIDPIVIAALSDLARGLRALRVRFCVIGALIPETLLDQFDSPDAAIVGLVANEDRRVLIEEADRLEVFDLYRWFRLAAAL